MLSFLIKRLLGTIPVVLMVMIAVFAFVHRRPGDPARLIASAEKAHRVLGWQPKYPDIETIVAHAWRWHQAHPNGYED